VQLLHLHNSTRLHVIIRVIYEYVCSNASVVAPLLERSRMLGPGGPRLLRLLFRCLFNGGLYTQRSRIARGAYAHVRTQPSAPAMEAAKYYRQALGHSTANFNAYYAQVLRAEAPALGRPETGVALKVTDMPSSVHDGHALVDVFSEVTLLESFARSPAVCQVNTAITGLPAGIELMPDTPSAMLH
jgi:hypothetical protein